MHGLVPILLLCSSLLATTANADNPIVGSCTIDANYTHGSAFEANLHALLSSLPATAAAAPTGFATNTTGISPDQAAYGLAQCRADVTDTSGCRTCLDGAAQDVVDNKCAGGQTAVLVYDNCMLRLSDESFFGAVDMSRVAYVSTVENATQQEQFTPLLGALMSNLTRKAAFESPRLFAVGSAAVTPFMNIYGMAQCTRDLTADDCNRCLVNAVFLIPSCCSGKVSGQLIYASCSIQFDVKPFYNIQAAEAAMSPAPVPAPGGGFVNGSDHWGAGSSGSSRRTARNTALLVSILVGLTLLLLLLLLAVYICKNRTATKRYGDDEEMRSSETLQYDLGTLRAATNNFSEENMLGKGGFGPVYKGTMQNGQEIAVKRLSTISQQGLVEMKTEIVLVAKLQHKNLVRLLGFCINEEEKLLVYEFLSNKSLNKILFDPATQQQLSWEQRYKIIEGIGRGLLYLHEDSRLTIIHRDLKPGNILLDADMNPKISDFGLAKLFKMESSAENTRHIAGTYGYMAPEYAYRGIFSTKSDVFSYGVLVLEIITGRRASEDLLSLVWRHWSLGSVLQLLDGYPAEEPGRQEMLRCIHIGLLCVEEDPQLRPRMASVLQMLRNRIVTMSPPTKPAFVVPIEKPMEPSEEPSMSINKVSVSDLEAR